MDFKITELEKDQRFDRFLRKYLKNNTEIKLGEIYKMIRKGIIKVNNKKHKDDYRLKEDDIINLPDSIIINETKDDKLSKFPLEKIKEMIVYEDENYIFFNKPAGITIHGGEKHTGDLTMNSFLEKYIEETGIKQSSTFSPAFCFRLDKYTSGVLIAGKNYDSLKYLNNLIKDHKTDKLYIAVVQGKAKNINIELPLEKIFSKENGKSKVIISENGKYAKTLVKVLKSKNNQYLGDISLVQVQLLTGRMHQIRVHLRHKKHPIIGDLMYGNNTINKLALKHYNTKRQLLHSRQYSFEYKGKKYSIKTAIPEDFNKLFK